MKRSEWNISWLYSWIFNFRILLSRFFQFSSTSTDSFEHETPADTTNSCSIQNPTDGTTTINVIYLNFQDGEKRPRIGGTILKMKLSTLMLFSRRISSIRRLPSSAVIFDTAMLAPFAPHQNCWTHDKLEKYKKSIKQRWWRYWMTMTEILNDGDIEWRYWRYRMRMRRYWMTMEISNDDDGDIEWRWLRYWMMMEISNDDDEDIEWRWWIYRMTMMKISNDNDEDIEWQWWRYQMTMMEISNDDDGDIEWRWWRYRMTMMKISNDDDGYIEWRWWRYPMTMMKISNDNDEDIKWRWWRYRMTMMKISNDDDGYIEWRWWRYLMTMMEEILNDYDEDIKWRWNILVVKIFIFWWLANWKCWNNSISAKIPRIRSSNNSRRFNRTAVVTSEEYKWSCIAPSWNHCLTISRASPWTSTGLMSQSSSKNYWSLQFLKY